MSNGNTQYAPITMTGSFELIGDNLKRHLADSPHPEMTFDEFIAEATSNLDEMTGAFNAMINTLVRPEGVILEEDMVLGTEIVTPTDDILTVKLAIASVPSGDAAMVNQAMYFTIGAFLDWILPSIAELAGMTPLVMIVEIPMEQAYVRSKHPIWSAIKAFFRG